MLFTEEDKRRGLDVHEMAVALSQGRSEDDRWHVRKDGSQFWASGVLTAVKDEDGVTIGLCKVLRDKTDVRTQIHSLENVVDKLKGDLDAGRKAVGSLAHELRNPLMPIVAAISLLQRKDAAHVSERATKILANQVDVLKRLVDDLATVSTDLSSTPRMNIESVNLNTVVAELVDGLLETAKSRHQTLSLVLPTSAIWVRADVARLQQMLINLLNNALKYTQDGGHVDVNASVEDGMAVVRIDDDGVGISAAMLPKIFELFTREGRQPDVAGNGVGLAVVKQLAAAHGGFVEARSPGPDKGASFSLRIPLH
jgi:signal transduction histidine kinase